MTETETASEAPTVLPQQPRLLAAWYVAAASADVGKDPISRTIWDTPLVLWRGSDGGVSVLLDRCPHRSVPLSMGRVVGNELQCGYHGWRFDTDGACAAVPGLASADRRPGRCATAYPTVEQQGFVWVWMDPSVAPVGEPFRFRHADDRSYLTVREELSAGGSLHQMIENALDVPHTAFLHGGLFRTDGERRKIDVVVRRFHDRAEAEYIGEARPPGIAGRILSPSGGTVTHFDRFHLPSIIEVEYRIGDENHIVLNGACSPVSDWETRMFAVVSVRTRFPGWMVKLAVKPVAMRIFGQDAVMLAKQTETVRRFGDERYLSTEIDLLGPHVLGLLRRAARGKLGAPDAQPMVKNVELLV